MPKLTGLGTATVPSAPKLRCSLSIRAYFCLGANLWEPTTVDATVSVPHKVVFAQNIRPVSSVLVMLMADGRVSAILS